MKSLKNQYKKYLKMKKQLLFSILFLLLIVTLNSCENVNQSYNPITDIDGNSYQVAKFGKQVWMLEELRTTKFNDGSLIPHVEDGWDTISVPAYCWHNNYSTDSVDSTESPPSYLYNWFTIDSTSNAGKNICPKGWHVPSSEEWGELVVFLDENREIDIPDWILPSHNSKVIYKHPGRRDDNGIYSHLDEIDNDPVKICWWTTLNSKPEVVFIYVVTNTTTHYAPRFASSSDDYMFLFDISNSKYSVIKAKNSGYCIRCVKD